MFSYQDLKRPFAIASFMLVCLFSFSSCGDGSQNNDAADASLIETPVAVSTKETDARFLTSVAEINYKEILAGKLARQRATEETVREMAFMLEEAHREAKSSLGSLAIMEGISVPASPTPAAVAVYDSLNVKSIEAFDYEYCTLSIKHHKEAITLFENAMRAKHDPEIQAWAVSKLPALRAQLSWVVAAESHLNPLSEVVDH